MISPERFCRTPKWIGALLWIAIPALCQNPAPAPKTPDKANAYYNFAMGHLYAELAGAYSNRTDYLAKAADHYKQALKADPGASFVLEELTELYVQANQLRSAINEAEEILKLNPENLVARRMLGRIYTRLIGDAQQSKVNEEMVKKSIEQYQFITGKDPKDLESWVTLGRLHRVSHNSVDAKKAFEKALEIDVNSEDALTGLAMVYSDVGDNKNMVEMLRRVADKSPNLRTLTELASAYEQMRDFAGAADVLRKAYSLNKGNGQVKRALAQSLLYTDQTEEAQKLYEELAGEETKDAQIQLRLSEIYRGKREFGKSRDALAKAKELDKNSVEVRYDEVNLLEAEGKNEEAIATLRKLIDDMPKNPATNAERNNRAMLFERLGGLYRNAQQWVKANDAFRQIGELIPEAAPRAAVNVLETWRMAKDFPKAVAEAQAARNKYPKDRAVRVAYGSLLADMGRAEEGAAEVRGLLGADKDRETYLALAQIYEKSRNFTEMEKVLLEAEKLSDSKGETDAVRFMRGAMYEKMKKFDQAEAEFRKVIESNPRSAGALNYLGYMLADRSVRLPEAKEMIEKALEIDPGNGAYLDSLGWVNYRLGKLDDAETYLRRSLEKTAGDPTVYDHLGDVYLKQGKLKEAIAQWQQSLREWETASKADADPAEVAKVARKLESARVRLAREGSQQRPQ